MKLHLPKLLRNAVLACITAVAGISTTVGTAAITGGVVAFALADQAYSAEYTDPSVTFADGDVLKLGNGATVSNPITLDSPDSSITFEVTDGTVTWAANQGENNGVSLVKVATGATLDITTDEPQLCVFASKQNADVTIELAAGAKMKSLNIFGWGNGSRHDAHRVVNMGAGSEWTIKDNTNFYLNRTDINLSGGTIVIGEGSKVWFERRQSSINTMADATQMSVIRGAGEIKTGNNGAESGGYVFNVVRGNYAIDATNTADLRLDSALVNADNAHGVQKTGDGIMELTAANTFTHSFFIRAGEAKFTGAGNMSSGNMVVDSGATLTLNTSATFASAITLQDGGVLNLAADQKLGNSADLQGTVKFTNAVTLTGAARFADTTVFDMSNWTGGDDYQVFVLGEGGSIVTRVVQVTGGSLSGSMLLSADGTLTSVSELHWNTGGSFTWDADTGFAGGTVQSDSVVIFDAGQGEVQATVADNMSIACIVVESGTDLVMDGASKVTAGSVRLDGNLELKTASLATSGLIVGEASNVILDGGSAKEWQMSELPQTSANKLETNVIIESGALYLTSSNQVVGDIEVKDGAGLRLGGNATVGKIVLNGDGGWTSGGEVVNAALLRNNGTGDISVAAVELATDSTVAVVGTDKTIFIGGELSGGILTKTGDGLLRLDGAVNNKGIVIDGGTVRWGGGTSDGGTNVLNCGSIVVNEGGVFRINHSSASCNSTAMVLNGGQLYSEDSSADAGTSFKSLEVQAASEIKYYWNGGLNFGVVTGHGDLSIVGRDDNGGTTFGKVKDYNGTITSELSRALNVGAVDQAAGKVMTIDTAVTLTNLTKTGEGGLVVTGAATLAGVVGMNYEGTLTLSGGITLAVDTTLCYTNPAGNVLSLGELTQSVAVDLFSLTDEQIASGVNLGITLAADGDAEALKNLLNVAGLSDYTITSKDGLAWLSSTAGISTYWDRNWGGKEIAQGPTELVASAVADGDLALNGNESYDMEGYVAINAIGGGENAIIYGGIVAADNGSYATANEDVWIQASAGQFKGLIGGSRAANWLISGGSGWNLNADTHIMVDGADTVVGHIIGGFIQECNNPRFNGSSYISVMNGEITGNIAGSSATCDGDTYTSYHTGNTNVFIYVPLSDTTTAAHLSTTNDPTHIVAGGSIALVHGTASRIARFEMTGETNVTIDLSGYGGDKDTFAKALYGGNYTNRTNTGCISKINGNTNLSIIAGNDITFNKDVVAGSLIQNGTSLISGTSSLNIAGGTYTGNIVGGTVVTNGATATVGATNVNITGGVLSSVVGASRQTSGEVNFTTGNVDINISGSTEVSNVYGGYKIEGTATAAVNASLGDVNITVEGGGSASRKMNIYGGSHTVRNHEASTINQGDITIELKGGIINDVYAAGSQQGSTKISTANTTVKVYAGASMHGTISGGYTVASGKSGSAITGDSTLKIMESNGSCQNLLFKDFSIIDTAADTTLGALSTAGFTKKGSANLYVKSHGNNSIGNATVAEGALTLNGNYAISGGVTVNNGASLITTGATTLGGALTLADGAALNVTAGALTLAGDAGAALTIDGKFALTMGSMTGQTMVLMSGVASGVSGTEVAADTIFSSITSNTEALDLSDFTVKLDGTNLVLVDNRVYTKELTWDAANSTWKVGSKFGSADADTFANGDTVTFGALTEATEEVTIDGAVEAASVSIAAGADKEYSFVSANSGQLTTSTLEIGAGTAKFGAGTLNVGALETLTVDGVLDISALHNSGDAVGVMNKVASATGTGTVVLGDAWWARKGGELTYNVNIEATDALEFNSYDNGLVVNIAKNLTITADDDSGDNKAGDLLLDNAVTLKVLSGASIDAAGTIRLGHESGGSMASHVELQDGASIKAASITKTAATGSTFTMTGGTLELTGTAGIAEGIAATISGGTIKTGANSWSITGAEIGGATIETGEGTITLNGATITSQLSNANGKVALAGTINVDTTNFTPAATPVTGYSEGQNGYQRTDSRYMLVSTVGNLSVSDVTWQVDGSTEGVSYADGGVTLTGTYGTEFYLRTVNATYSNLAGDNHAAMTAVVLDGGGLNLNQALNDGVTIKVQKEGESVVDVANGVTLASASVTSDATHKMKLHGAGTYALADGVATLGDGVVLGDWTGTVKLTNVISNEKLNISTTLNPLANASSSVTATNVKGYLDTGNTLTANLVLVNAADGTSAISITNGNADASPGDRKAVISGSVSGDGDIAFSTWSGINSKYATYEFTGEISGWTGSFVNKGIGQYSGYANVIIAGDTEINASVVNDADRYTGSKLYLTIGGESDVTMNGAVNVDKLTVNQNTSFTNTVAATDMVIAAAASVTNDLSLTTLSNTGSLTATDKSITVTGAVTGAGSIDAGALTLQAATNTVGALTLSGDLTLGTAEATSSLTATSLTMGATDSSVVLNKLGTNLLTVGTLDSALDVSIADSLLEAMIQDGTSSLELMTLTDIGSYELSLNGETSGYGVADGQYLLTLDRDATTGVVTLVVASQGSIWGGTGDDADNLWSSATNWNGGVVPAEDESVVFDGRGSSTVVIDGEIMVENLTFATNTDTTEVPEPVTEYTLEAGEGDSLLLVNSNLAVNNGSTVNVATEVAVANHTRIANGATLTVNEGGALRSQNGIENNGTINNNYDVIIGSGVSVGSATSDTLTNNGTFNNNAEGVLTVGQDIINSGTLNNAGELSVVGAVDNSGSIAVTDGTVTIGATGTADDVISLDNSGTVAVSGGVVTINGSVDNSGEMTVSGGEVAISGNVTNTGELTVSGGETSIGGDVANQGNLTVSSGELAIEGSVDNTNGDISIGSEGNSASMTVGGDLTGTGATDKLTVEEGSSLAVGGDLTAADVALEFGGDVTVGGTATVGELTIAENASFAAANATIGGVSNDGTLTVGTVDTATGELVGGELNIDSLSGSGDVAVGKDGVLNIDSMTEFSGQLTGEGTLNTGDNAFVLESRQEGAASITAGSLEITEAANGSVINGKLTTDEIVVEKLSGSVTTPVLTTGELAARTTDGKITIVLSEVEAGSVDATSSTLLICVEDGMSGTLADNFDLSRYGYDAAGEYDADSAAVQSDYMQELLGKGLIVRFSETEPTPTTSLLTAGTGMDVYAQIDNQSAEEATWEVSGDRTAAGYIVGTNTNGTIILNDEASLDNVQIVNVDTDATLDITGMNNVQLNNVYSANGSTLTVVGGDTGTATMNATALGVEGASVVADSVELAIDGDETQHLEELTVRNGATVYVDGTLCTESIDLSDADSALVVEGVADTVALNGTGELVGELIIVDGPTTQPGNFTGAYTDATVWMEGGKQTLAPDAGLTVAGDSGTATLAYDTDATMDALATTGATIVLDRAGGTTLELTKDSSMYKGQLKFGVTAEEIAEGTVQVIGGNLDMEQTRVTISIDTEEMVLDVDAMGDTLAQVGTGSSRRVSVELDGDVFDKYFSGASMVNGAVVTERNESYYSDAFVVDSKNGQAGLALASAALLNVNPQATNPEGGLAKVLDEFDKLIATGDAAAADDLGAALAGASTAVLGVALQDDVERQLKAIRNRTTTMGVDQTVVNHDMPYFNAWINAEGDHRELSDDGTAGGYTINSWGGTVGFDVDICPTFTAGLALTAMYGDLDVSGADEASGDMDTYYVSAFARYCASAWTHTFVATAGLADLSLDRTVMGEKVSGESDAISFGLMYEVGRVFALNEDATACLQPIFNVSWRHTEMEGYQEKGSDLGLTVGDQTLDTVTFGLGARLQAVVGESMYNRTSIFECRVLAKADVGDRQGDSKVGLAGLTTEVESAEIGAFGLEAGAGLTIPLGDEGSSIFMDASVELRADYTNVNGTVGYRINF